MNLTFSRWGNSVGYLLFNPHALCFLKITVKTHTLLTTRTLSGEISNIHIIENEVSIKTARISSQRFYYSIFLHGDKQKIHH
ncbi:hypothetical protein DLT86_09335 [Shigella sonnei]|nr:hypothetical protein [Shigella sonnei]EFW1695576.1 hypothetical protein [Shigella sonnei]EFW1709012.1 hypothetical protein [Shigella sonnei]EFW4799021.1 hypothetical protein [Shigella sonnei]EFX1715940.1 hypothetical protein [Shigella sonnei]